MSNEALRVTVLALDDGGGMRHYAQNLAQALQRHCTADVHLIGYDDEIEKESVLGKVFDSLPKGDRLRRFYNPKRAERIAKRLLFTRRPSVVHLTSGAPCTAHLIRHLQAEGVTVVLTVHDVEPHHERRTAWGRLHSFVYLRWGRRASLRRADALHVHSRLHHEDLRRLYGDLIASDAYVVPHGGGLTDAMRAGKKHPPELEAAGICQGYGLFFGRIHPYKGVNVLIEALLRLRSMLPGFQFVIAGAGELPPMPDVLRQNVVLVNRFIHDDEIYSLVGAAQYLVLPYTHATQTGVVPLASALEKPAIVTMAGALRELIIDGKTGFVVPTNDPGALADSLYVLASEPKLAFQMGQEAKQFLDGHYAWPAVAAAHAHVYRSLLAGKGVKDGN